MRGKTLGVALSTFLLAFSFRLEAQQAKKLPRIGFLIGSSAAIQQTRLEAFRHGLNELGYTEGKNIIIEYRYAEGKLDRLNDFATEFVRLKEDIIVTAGPLATGAAKKATNTIPIVMTVDIDPVGSGFVFSLARPGGNITGLSTLSPEISGKRLELLKEIVPKLSRVAIFETSSQPGNAESLTEIKAAAETFGVQLQYVDVLEPKNIETAFQTAGKDRADAVLMVQSPVFSSQRKHFTELAIKSRLPAIYNSPEYVEDGGLISYGVSFTDLFRRAASYVDRIIKGGKPANLPVEQPTKFELVINLKAAKEIGLTIPQSVLIKADRVIQ